MGFNVPILNRDSEWCRKWVDERTHDPATQKRLVLVVVSVALFLDNMLYMVIVPIIPQYLRDIRTYDVEYINYHNETRRLKNGTILVRNVGGQFDYVDEEIELGWLFASKALIQILVNPFSGFIIDRIGYELPMVIGLVVMFCSTAIFALGRTYGVLFFARSLQGLGSAFADTSGLAMIADRFTEENERSAALGIALAFISFGCLVAPPFGSVLYSIAGKPAPFIILILLCFVDLIMVFLVIEPTKSRPNRGPSGPGGEKLKGTPIWQLFQDPFIAVCSGALIMANVSLAFLEPTIATWMRETMPDTPAWQLGIIWLPAFIPHVLGVYVTVKLLKKYPQHPWLLALIGLAMEGLSCISVPFTTSAFQLILPLSTICFGIALVDTSLLPMLGYLVDTRHVSVYGSVYAIADISYSLAYAFGPIIAGEVVSVAGFLTLNLIICVLNVAYLPVLGILRRVYAYENLDGNTIQKPTSGITGERIIDGNDSGENGGPIRQNGKSVTGKNSATEWGNPMSVMNSNSGTFGSWGDQPASMTGGAGYGSILDSQVPAKNPFGAPPPVPPPRPPVIPKPPPTSFDPLNPQW